LSRYIKAPLIDELFTWIGQVTGLMTQGRSDGSEWVTSYMISYSLDAYHWVYVNDYYGNRRVRTS